MTTDLFGTPIIDVFRGDYAFLSSFFLTDITLWGVTFRSAEHAYQWSKTDDPKEKHSILWTLHIPSWSNPDPGDFEVPSTPGRAKKRGDLVTKRLDWDEIKYDKMLEIVRAKFEQNADLRALLAATGDSILIEGNMWHDNFWGSCTCSKCGSSGSNMLGRILIQVRNENNA